MDMRVIYTEVVNEGTPQEEEVVRNWATTAQGASILVKTKPGVGKPYWAFNTIPAGVLIGADMTGAPLATASNASTIAGITALAEDVLAYETE